MWRKTGLNFFLFLLLFQANKVNVNSYNCLFRPEKLVLLGQSKFLEFCSAILGKKFQKFGEHLQKKIENIYEI